MRFLYPLLTCLLLLATRLPLRGQAPEPDLKITPLTGDCYVYTTYQLYEGYRLPAHGMYLVTPEGVALLDTPWDTTQFQPLLDSITRRHEQPVRFCIATHWHSDRTEGLEYYRHMGIPTYTTALTDSLSRVHQKKRAEFLIRQDTSFRLGAYTIETYYPGPGHTQDNIVLWIPAERILYGGCLIKGASARNLGNLEDADLTEYENSLRNVHKRYPRPRYILVSHSDWKSLRSLRHSIRLAGRLRGD